MPLKLFGEFWRQRVQCFKCIKFHSGQDYALSAITKCMVTLFTLFIPSISPEPDSETKRKTIFCIMFIIGST